MSDVTELATRVVGHCITVASKVIVGSPCRWAASVDSSDLAAQRVSLTFWIPISNRSLTRSVNIRINALPESESDDAFVELLTTKTRKIVADLKAEYARSTR